ncbi:MAG: site-specific integrase [Eubacteriales bacterium]
MVTDFEKLVSLCDEELQYREYSTKYYARITHQWSVLQKWLEKKGITEFNEEIGNNYCDEIFGTHLMPKGAKASFREKLRAIRILISYQKNGDFEFRCPGVEYIFDSELGVSALNYLEYCRNELILAEKTIENKRFYLHQFCRYLKINRISVETLSTDITEVFFAAMGYSLASRHNAARTISLFLRFIYDNGETLKDNSIYILPDNYRKDCKIPTTYEEEEIKKLIDSVDRSSAIGKRDYLVLLLATEYGWRAKDITLFSFHDIDWDKNIINFHQHKTNVPIEFPLLSTVGNAIIDYLKYSRPNTNVPELIVSLENANKGKSLSSPTIHSIVTKYMKRAEIQNWQKKKHGPHAMRHSLATNLLKKNVSMPIISTIMGHQRTETTSTYLSVDYNKLKQCVLPMPILKSPFYTKEDNHGSLRI